jgi:hypothetical protein
MADGFGARLLGERLAAADEGAMTAAAAPALPDYVLYALARMWLLHGLPFQYLVPDPRLLPLESIRFFHLDAAWLSELCRGALAVGSGGSREDTQAGAVLSGLWNRIGPLLSEVRDVERGRKTVGEAVAASAGKPAPPGVSGFLLRSALVSGWPDLHVRAFASGAVVPVLRLEQLAPSVLLVLFAGTPDLVWLSEPHHGVQFGMEKIGSHYEIPLRDEAGGQLAQRVTVPLRPGAETLGVVDVRGLAQALDSARWLGAPRGSAALALALLRPPARQPFQGGTP